MVQDLGFRRLILESSGLRVERVWGLGGFGLRNSA